jgi:hypothetical protein
MSIRDGAWCIPHREMKLRSPAAEAHSSPTCSKRRALRDSLYRKLKNRTT